MKLFLIFLLALPVVGWSQTKAQDLNFVIGKNNTRVASLKAKSDTLIIVGDCIHFLRIGSRTYRIVRPEAYIEEVRPPDMTINPCCHGFYVLPNGEIMLLPDMDSRALLFSTSAGLLGKITDSFVSRTDQSDTNRIYAGPKKTTKKKAVTPPAKPKIDSPCGADKLYYWVWPRDEGKKAYRFYDSMVHKYPCSPWTLEFIDLPAGPIRDAYYQDDGYTVSHNYIVPTAMDMNNDPVLKHAVILKQVRAKTPIKP